MRQLQGEGQESAPAERSPPRVHYRAVLPQDYHGPVHSVDQVRAAAEAFATSRGAALSVVVVVETDEQIRALQILLGVFTFLRVLRLRRTEGSSQLLADEEAVRAVPARGCNSQRTRCAMTVAAWRSHPSAPALSDTLVRDWKVVMVPATYRCADVRELLMEQGLREIELRHPRDYTQHPCSSWWRCTWTARASTPLRLTTFETRRTEHGETFVIRGRIFAGNS